ncbi:MAG: heme ABC transporter ATP-binding protein [Pseudomonadota bacterium]
MSLIVTKTSFDIARKPILRAVDFRAEPGEITAIVGPNGSGKTSLLRAISGDIRASGEISINGRNIASTKAAELARIRGVLAQSTQVAFDFTAFEVVRFGLRAGVHANNPDLPHAALSKVGLAGFADRYYLELSGGEQQRVQLARVLTQVWEPVFDGEPSWLLLDEPVASLDIGHQLEIVELLRDYVERGGGVVAVMHDLNLTAMMADKVAVMQSGRILESGPLRQVINDATLSHAYDCQLRVGEVPSTSAAPFVLPQTALPKTFR